MHHTQLTRFQGVDMLSLADTFGTPFYVYDSERIKKSYETLRSALPATVDIFYSIKANPNVSICAYLASLGACMEVCSLVEIETVIKVGVAPQHIIFVGPLKSEAALKRSIEYGVYCIVCESLLELEKISSIARSLNRIVKVALRINPDFVAEKALLKMGGKASQFGMDISEILAHETFILNTEHVQIIGIHIYNGTRILDAKTIADNTRSVLALAEELMKRWRREFSFIDIGGGIGIPYFADETPCDMALLASFMYPLIQEFHHRHKGARIILESGRFLVGPAGMLVSRVEVIKTSKGEHFLVTDGGTHCHLAAVGIGSFIKRNFPVVAFAKNEAEECCEYHITGPLCTPGDLIARQVTLPRLSVGDLIGIQASGAYGPTASPVLFLSHGYPAEIFIKDGVAHLIRSRDGVADFLAKQQLVHFKQ